MIRWLVPLAVLSGCANFAVIPGTKVIDTKVPGIRISEHFPRMATMADRYAIVRSVHHKEAPIHETGHQLMQTGRLFRAGPEYPHYGAVLSRLRGSRASG